jgi:hypothetical protein
MKRSRRHRCIAPAQILDGQKGLFEKRSYGDCHSWLMRGIAGMNANRSYPFRGSKGGLPHP